MTGKIISSAELIQEFEHKRITQFLQDINALQYCQAQHKYSIMVKDEKVRI
jgi:hypothetical protein